MGQCCGVRGDGERGEGGDMQLLHMIPHACAGVRGGVRRTEVREQNKETKRRCLGNQQWLCR